MPLNSTTTVYSVSPPPVATKTDKGGPAPWKRGSDFALRLQVELDSSSDVAATKSQLPPVLFICGKFTADRPQRNAPAPAGSQHQDPSQCGVPCHGEGNAPAPQAVRPLAPVLPLPLFHRSIGGNSAPASALPPLGFVCGRPRLCGRRYIFKTLF
jgi:hypothetical protein